MYNRNLDFNDEDASRRQLHKQPKLADVDIMYFIILLVVVCLLSLLAVVCLTYIYFKVSLTNTANTTCYNCYRHLHLLRLS
jgi:hypothetical protein